VPERISDSEVRARAFWSGTITFCLVSIPVNLFPANRSGGVSFRMVDEEGTPLARVYFCPREDRPIDWDEIVRGYKLDDGDYVEVTEEELEALEPRKSRDIDLRRFVPAEQIEPIYFERGYYLTPGGESTNAYMLLAETMQRAGRAGIATFVMRVVPHCDFRSKGFCAPRRFALSTKSAHRRMLVFRSVRDSNLPM
jgi:DNA end-binding protein Ku